LHRMTSKRKKHTQNQLQIVEWLITQWTKAPKVNVNGAYLQEI